MVSTRQIHFPVPLGFAIFGALLAYYAGALLMGAHLPLVLPVLLVEALLLSALSLLRALRPLRAGGGALLGRGENREQGGAATGRGAAGGNAAWRRIGEAGSAILFLALGLSLGLAARLAAAAPVRYGQEKGAIRALTGILVEDPRLQASGGGTGTLSLLSARAGDGTASSARGRLQVFFPEEALGRLAGFGRGSRLYLEGELLPPREGKGAALREDRFRARALHVSAAPGVLENFRTKLRLGLAGLYGGRSWGGLALALLFGIRDSLDGDMARAWRDAGLSHVLALSGMHLGVIAAILAFFLKRPLGIRAAGLVSSGAVVLYVALAAVQPSLARSAIMYLIGTLCLVFALPRKLPLILGISFIIQILIWPASGDSLSFILSYLALAGIVFLGEPLAGIFRGRVPPFLAAPLSASIGAFAASMGVTAFYFSLVQPAGIIAGLPLSPLVTVFMAASMAAPLLMMIPPLAAPVDFFMEKLHALMAFIVNTAGKAPPFRFDFWPLALIISFFLIFLILFWRSRLARGERCAPFAAP